MPAALPLAVLLKRFLIGAASVGGLHALARHHQTKIDLFFMRLFRDLGRYKAYKRRQQQSNGTGLISMLLRQDDPLLDLFLDNNSTTGEHEDRSDLPTYTLSELFEFGSGYSYEEEEDDDHSAEPATILISIFGLVYDVTKGAKFYGPDGSYPQFAGHDITYCLATGSKHDDTCLNQMDYYQDYYFRSHENEQDNNDTNNENSEPQEPKEGIEDTDGTTETPLLQFTPQQLDEGKRWLSFFHLHDKYPLVGTLELHQQQSGDGKGRVVDWDAWLNQLVTNEVEQQQNDTTGADGEKEDKPNIPPILQQRATTTATTP